jgi:serine/threonine-protein kinase
MWRQRFLQEARAASKIRHVNVVEMFDFGMLFDGAGYYVMELLEGRDLAALIRELGSIPWPRARSILLQLVRGLGAAHACGVIHRDVKPANCFLLDASAAGQVTDSAGGPDLVKMLDFGIAKVVGEDGAGLTATNELLGTAAYMAPERAARGVADIRADIYAVGIVAYKMLTGDVPFRGETMFGTLSLHVHTPPPPMRDRQPSIPAVAEQVVLKALAKHPDDRYQTMAEFEEALLSLDEGRVGYDGFDPVPCPAVIIPTPGPRTSVGASTYDSATEVDARVASLTEARTLTHSMQHWSRSSWFAGVVGAALAVSGIVAAVWLGPKQGVDTPDERPSVAEFHASPVVVFEQGAGHEPSPPDGGPGAAPVVEAEPSEAETGADQGVPPPDERAEEAEEPEHADRTPRRKVAPRSRIKRQSRHDAKPPAPTTDAAVIGHLRNMVRSRCAGMADSTKVLVKFSILSTGRVSLPRANPPHEHSPAGTCVVRLVRKAAFPEGRMRAAQLEVKL